MATFLLCLRVLFPWYTHWEEQEVSLSLSSYSYKTTNSIMRALPSQPHLTLVTLLPLYIQIPSHWLWKLQIWFVGDEHRHSVYNTFWLYDLARAINLTIFLITPKIVVTKLCLSLSTQRMTNMLYAGALSPICCWRWAFLMNHSTDTLSWLLGLSKEPQHSHCL